MRHWYRQLYFWVVIGILAGGAIGYANPALGVALQPLSEGFIALIRMLIGPIVFCTIVLGIVAAGDMKKVGRIGVKTLLYFETVSTFALAIGMLTANMLKPGAGFHADAASLDADAVSGYATAAKQQSLAGFLLHIIPKTFIDAFSANGDLLQVLLLAVLFGYALNRLGERAARLQQLVEEAGHVFFAMMNVIMKLAPLGAGAAMAFTLGKYGAGALKPMLTLMAVFYLTCALFVLIVLGVIARLAGFGILRFLSYIRHEILLVLGTSSSESALVPLMARLEALGCPKSVTGLVVPAGYSFNLDGTNIYMTLATLFIAQALGIELSFSQQLTIFAVAMLTSKGASGVTGAGFITLAATLAVVPDVPVAGIALVLGVDRFMSEARAITNLIGNGVAAIVMSKWEKSLDKAAFERFLRGGDRPDAELAA